MKKIFFLSMIFSPLSLSAHPHVWADASLKLNFNKNGEIYSITEIWVYDDMFSMAVISETDKNSDGVLDEEETENLKKLYFDNIIKFSFYTHICIQGKESRIKLKLKDFSPEIADGKISYVFTVTLPRPLNPFKNKVDLGIYDSGYYTDISYDDDPIFFEGIKKEDCPYFIFQDAKHPTYFGMVNPDTIALCRKK